MAEIDQLVINNPYVEPSEYWKFNEETQEYDRRGGRRPAGYVKVRDEKGDMHGTFVQIDLANRIRERVKAWRDSGYIGVTATTRELLEHWNNPSKDIRNDRLFFCQREAIETAIWMTEADKAERIGIDVPTDGGAFTRYCLKMATGTGKTIVMGMLIVWQALNKINNPTDGRFSKHFLIVAPGLTVKSRLDVLWPPDSDGNYYHTYSLIPDSMREKLKEAVVVKHNWHTFFPGLDEHSVDTRKHTREDDTSFSRRILGHNRDNIIVINDEAHHAWRKSETVKADKSEQIIATNWIDGLDKIHRAREIKTCYDFTATPYMPSGKKTEDQDVYKWIISDFSLNDAIESGLVKTPRMPVGDDGKELQPGDKSKYYHLYEHKTVKSGLKVSANETDPLPDLVRTGYMLLARDWQKTRKRQKEIPPVMITVCNLTKTSSRIRHFFENDPHDFGELKKDMIRIDSDMIKMESGTKKSDKNYENLRKIIDTVGQKGKPGEQVKNIIAVQMLSEGWDAKNVTQIMGLRAFTSQLLCEQVVGRGLRRQSYDLNEDTGLFNEEYVNILGVPFSFLPHEGRQPPPEKPKKEIRPNPDNIQHEIAWPNISRIETAITAALSIDWRKVETLHIDARKIDTSIHLAPMLDKMPRLDSATEIQIRDATNLRFQTIMFYVVKDICKDLVIKDWNDTSQMLFARMLDIARSFFTTDKICITNMPDDLEIRRNMAILFSASAIIKHITRALHVSSKSSKMLIFGFGNKMRSTRDVTPWWTTKHILNVKKSHIDPSPYDNNLEKDTIKELEKNARVESWVKNDRTGFSITYQYEGEIREYYPDFLVRLGSVKKGFTMLVLETKGIKSAQNDAKHKALAEWTEAVSNDGRFGEWVGDVAYDLDDVVRIIKQYSP